MSEYEIRAAQIDDATGIAQLVGQLGYEGGPSEVAERLTAIARDASGLVLTAEAVRGHIIGWLHVLEAIRVESNAFAEIAGLVVAEGWRGRGVGRALVHAAEQWTVARGLPRVRVRSNVVRDEARAFYERLGFTVTKSQRIFDKPVGEA